MKMSNAHKSFSAKALILAAGLAVLLLLAVAAGCSPDRKGTASANRPPEVYIVNTPPDGATFSRNPELNWYATDGDGFLAFFRYAVVVDSNLTIGGQHVPVDDFVAQATDLQFGWDTLSVDLDHPQSTASVRLYANIDFPIDSFVTQYFFIQVQDDKGAKSDIKWRRYARNDHYPNTHFRADQVYINAKDANSLAPGITMTWDGADSTDWGRTKPPLEFEWRLYGPFDANAPVYINIVRENCVWDPTTQTYVNCVNTKVLDLTALPPAVGGVPQPLAHSEGPNYASNPADVWVSDQETSIYDVFKDVPNLTKTSQYKFLFWVRARDDGYVPDPTPSFSQFLVVEALFEKSVAIFDETYFKFQSSYWYPKSLDMQKTIYAQYINTALADIFGAGYVPFDTITVTDTFLYDPAVKTWETDYFHRNITKSSVPGHTSTNVPVVKPSLTDILSHKVIIVLRDQADGSLQEDVAQGGMIGNAYFGMEMGASGWYMGRNLGTSTTGTNNKDTEPGLLTLSANFAIHFGFEQVEHEAWEMYSVGRAFHQPPYPPIWNEQFIGAYSLVPELFPQIDIDLDSLLSRYVVLDDSVYFPNPAGVDTHFWAGLPEVGAGTRTTYASPVYLYKSKDSVGSSLNGKVMGVAQDVNDTRSLAFLFTPLAVRPEQSEQLFRVSLTWLMDKFLRAEGMPKAMAGYGGSGIEARRQRVRQYLDEINESGLNDPQLFNELKLNIPKEIEIPTDVIITP
ncbi:MAG: hypothetical protein PHR28_05445, partial [candidate division Zixibacteria bacterium]|nr:hypothetical protein [candidate division Zixibacteria bacterium]